MPEAPRIRPEHAEVLLQLRGYVRARPKDVFEALAERLDPGPDAESMFTAEPAGWLVVSQGGWWYRAEYRVVPDARGSHVEHTLLNVAERAHGLGRFTARKVVASAPADFERLVAGLRAELE